jgi:hypothetical protein
VDGNILAQDRAVAVCFEGYSGTSDCIKWLEFVGSMEPVSFWRGLHEAAGQSGSCPRRHATKALRRHGNMVLVNSGIHTRKNFPENYLQLGHAMTNFANPPPAQRDFNNVGFSWHQIIVSLPASALFWRGCLLRGVADSNRPQILSVLSGRQETLVYKLAGIHTFRPKSAPV